MSESKVSPYKATGCGGGSLGTMRDGMSGSFHIQVIGSDPDVNGVKTGASITALTGDYAPDPDYTNGRTFLICIETAGIFFVTLQDGTDFLITTVQSTAYLGMWYPAKLLSVNVGTTGNFSVGY